MTRRASSDNAVSPHQFSPLWNPPFPVRFANRPDLFGVIPPFKKELTKGGKPQGAPARRNHGADGGMEPLSLHAPHGLRQAQALPSAPRRPEGCRRHSAAHPPLRLALKGWRFGRAGSGCGRSDPRTLPALHGTAYGDLVGHSHPDSPRGRDHCAGLLKRPSIARLRTAAKENHRKSAFGG